jgi:threonine dehydratase
LGIAFASRRLGVDATVVVPATASAAKTAKLRGYDIELIEVGATYEEAEKAALALADERDALYVSPYNDALVIAGQSTMAAEILTQLPGATDLVVSVGGGGLLSGSLLRSEGSGLTVHGALVEQNSAFATAMEGREVDESLLGPTIADGLAGGIERGAVTVEIAAAAQIDLHLVPEDAIRAALRAAMSDAGLVIEGSAAVALAVALHHGASMSDEIVVALSGRNITPTLLADVMAG